MVESEPNNAIRVDVVSWDAREAMIMTQYRSVLPTESDEKPSGQLHLPDLVVRGFRGLEDLNISSLGRVTMITGKNSVGKTSILDAVRVYAARGSYAALTDLLRNREEFANTTDEDGDSVSGIDLSGLFNGWEVTDDSTVIIGSSNDENQLKIEVGDVTEEQLELFGGLNPEVYELGNKMLSVRFNGFSNDLPWVFSFDDFAATMAYRLDRRFPQIHRRLRQQRMPSDIPCATFGPGLPGNFELADTWDKITFTDDENRALDALKIILGDDIVRVAVIGGTRDRFRREPRLIAGRMNHNRQFPLKAFGDGALRMLGIALALVKSRDGFLLIDEAENGIHYSFQADFWRMVLMAAHENNVQVIATTHSYDCVLGFAQAAFDISEVDGRLVQLSRDQGALRVAELPENELTIAAQQRIEVRG